MDITCVSDLHGHYPQLKGGDLLIVAGDLTARHTFGEFAFDFITWLSMQDYKRKIVIAGNHDTMLGDGAEDLLKTFATYLCDSGTEFEFREITSVLDSTVIIDRNRKFKVWGSPWTLRFPGMNPNCMAFTCETEEELAEKWAMIPDDVDILVTHSPSFGNLDILPTGESVGSVHLWMEILMKRPKLHVFGHVHNSYGHVQHYNGIHLVNASHVNERYEAVNKPIRIEL